MNKKRDTSKKRQSILEAAVQAFLAEGYDGTSMDRIALLAGASKRTVYNHFPSKDELFQAIILKFGQEMHTLKQISYDPVRSLEDQLTDFVDAELAVVSNPAWMGFVKVLLTVFIRSPEIAKQAMATQMATEDSITAWVRAAALDGKLSVEDPVLAGRVFSALMGGAFTWPAVYQGDLDPSGFPVLKRELVATFLSRYRKAPESASPPLPVYGS